MKNVGKLFAFVGFLALCFAFGFCWQDIQKLQAPSGRAIGLLFGVRSASAATPEEEFQHAYTEILNDYVKPVDRSDLKYAGMEGLMASLGDPHTMFMPPKMAEAFNDETSANFGGVGARLSPDPLGAKIVTVFAGGPAATAGIESGNIVTGVDGKSVTGVEIDDIVTKIKGKEGTNVRLTVIEKDKDKPVTITVKRARITAPTVDTKYLPDSQIGYMAIASFSEPTANQFDDGLKSLESHPLKGLVIDLRDNPGGLLETAVDMISRFVEDKLVVTMKFRDGHEEVARTYPGSLHTFNYPIAILMNEYSASAAEIFAGCLHDYGRVKLVGTHSYGKASVQNVFRLVDKSSAKITIAKYFLPETPFFGRKVDQYGAYVSGGLMPDLKVELSTDTAVTYGDPSTDNQLSKAIQLLNPTPVAATAAAAGPSKR